MEPKPPAAPHGDGPPAEAPRRRGGGGKRKAAGSGFTPSKRHAKERNAAFNVPHHLLHSGPLTRAARHSPHKLTGAPPDAAPAAAVADGSGKGEGDAIRFDGEQTPAEETPLVDEGFEAVRSRDAGVHVVPTFAGWFSWKEIHPVEEQTLPSFFNGKSEKRTPEIYSGIRNSIVMKFHANPQLQLEPKDLAELSIGEVDARQEVFNFLDHWGLINFHPFPPVSLEESQSDSQNEEKASVIEKLFKFEPIQSYMIPLPTKGEVETPPPLPTFLPDPVLVEDVVAAAEPSVEYHCNSCSVDCSGKRFHCRTQADFDLCSNCYDEEKFDPGMSKTDFILMDSAEVSGARGTSWTDEETLLLLEALEIFGGKWTEIAEHVATKTKTQCMLHFLQMQIEDRFHGGEDIHQNIHESKEQALAEKGTPEVPEKMEVEGKDTEDEKPSEKTEANNEEAKTEEGSAVENEDTNNSGGVDSVAVPNADDSVAVPNADEPKPSSDADLAKEHPVTVDTSDENASTIAIDTSGENASNNAIDILKSAFEAVGHFPGDEGSFADAGNPVMALAAFLAGLVEDDNATTSCRSSLKAISEDLPALQLASRHCYILEDPPSDLKDNFVSVSNTNKDGDQAKDDDMIIDSIGTEKKDITEKEENALPVEKQNSPSILPKDQEESDNKKVSCDDEAPSVEPKSNNAKESGDPIPLVDKSATNDTEGSLSTKDSVAAQDNANGCASLDSQEVVAGNTKAATNPEEDKPGSEVVPDDDSSSHDNTELNKTEDAVATPTIIQEDEKSQTLGNGKMEEPNGAENVPADVEKGSRVTAKHDDSITRLKRAAATAISAAAVKAKLLAEQEEDQIRRLAALVVEKLLQKTEAKMSLFVDVEHVALRTREYTEKTRKKLLMERNAIIAARMGAMPSRPNQQGVAGNRLPPGYGAPAVRPPNAMPRPGS